MLLNEALYSKNIILDTSVENHKKKSTYKRSFYIPIILQKNKLK